MRFYHEVTCNGNQKNPLLFTVLGAALASRLDLHCVRSFGYIRSKNHPPRGLFSLNPWPSESSLHLLRIDGPGLDEAECFPFRTSNSKRHFPSVPVQLFPRMRDDRAGPVLGVS